ncbi:MAG: hypothetical protein OEZ06_12890 [Myxococcales bacterium]|nr:hypothetical protein [Myxococcales bacterium]
MTWHTRRVGGRLADSAMVWTVAAGIALMVGCGDDPKKVELSLTTPAPGAVLTSADDIDSSEPGVQVTVQGESKGLKQGTGVVLLIDEAMVDATATIDAEGGIEMPGVTLPTGMHTIVLRTETGSASSDEEQTYTLRSLRITSPAEGDILGRSDDQDVDAEGIQINVTVQGDAVDLSQGVTLLLDGAEAGTAEAGSGDEAVVTGVTLSTGSHTLQARTGEGADAVSSDEIEVTVSESCPSVTFVSPEPPASGEGLTLGGQDACPASGEAFTVDVLVSTDAASGRAATLIVNGQAAATANVSGATLSFEGVAINKRDAPNTLAIEVEDAEGVSCRTDFPGDILVDCAGPDCSIDSPVAVTVMSGGSSTNYVNASMRDDSGYDIQVGTSAEAAGQDVELVIDGRSADALSEQATASGATFAAVDLADGQHTVEAFCRDAAGNVTSSGELTWTVDATPCSVSLTDPGADTLYVAADDEDGGSSGTQVVVTAEVSGSDCGGQRSAVCDPTSGIASGDFVTYDGTSPLLATITLDDGAIDQSLCLEIEDAAGNVGLASVAVAFRDVADAPRLLIESPSDGDSYNALGDGTHTADVDRSSATACDANFSIACTELGSQVQLRHDSPEGVVFASGDCVAPASGDPALPSGYSGRAVFEAAFGDGDQSATIVATQTVTGSSTSTLVGASPAITLGTDCALPALIFTNDPCNATGSGQLATDAEPRDFFVVDGTNDIATLEAVITHDSAADQILTPATVQTGLASFTDIVFGGVGNATLTATITDDFGNQASLSCMVEIVEDLPSVAAFATPTGGTTFGPGDGCDTGDPSKFGAAFVGAVDTDANRTATIFVDNAVAVADVAIAADGSISECVPVPHPGGTVTLRVDSTLGTGFDTASVVLDVALLVITDPVNDQVLLATDDCGGSGFAYQILVDADPSLNGLAYTATGSGSSTGSVSGGAISVCLDLAEGPGSVAVSIDGTSISDTVDVTVAATPPAAGIVIDSLAAPDPLDATHREGVTASWTEPTQAWTGQLLGYELRCAGTELLADASDASKNSWWDAAEIIALPAELTPDDAAPEALLSFHPEQLRHCVVRATDPAGQMTPILHSTNLTLKFRQLVLSQGTGTPYLGFKVTRVGDVDGDGIEDILIGGLGRAELFFGAADGFSSSADVVFFGDLGGVGASVTGIGDFDGDGRNDFAIADPNFASYFGRVSIFFGRPKADWPASPINLDSACNADLCLDNAGSAYMGTTLSPAGDFDADGRPDLAIGSPYAPGFASEGELLIILGDAYQTRSCSVTDDCRMASEDCTGPDGSKVCTLKDGQTFWRLAYSVPSGNWTNPPAGGPVARLDGFVMTSGGAIGALASGIAALGPFDTTAGADLAIGALGDADLHFLSGRSSDGVAGLDVLATTELGLRAPVTMVPDGMPVASGAGSYGYEVSAIGQLLDIGPSSGLMDVAVSGSLTSEFVVQPGDPASASDPRFSSTPTTVSGGNVGQSIANGYHPVLTDASDFDGDGLPEICASDPLTPDIRLWYGDDFLVEAADNAVNKNTAIQILLDATQDDTLDLEVEFVGDVNGDGHPDMLIGDFWSFGTAGQAILLY